MSGEHSDPLTNEAIPRTHATLTIRVIKSFEFRTEKHLILRDVNCETTTVGQLKDMVREGAHDHQVPPNVGWLIPLKRYRHNQDGNPIAMCNLVCWYLFDLGYVLIIA